MKSLIQWHEGMLISPQHFQQSINYSQNTLSRAISTVSPFGYGLFDLKIDTSSLSSGLIRVLKVNGIFQDGLLFDFDAMEDKPLELNLSEYFMANTGSVKIHLAIPNRRYGENMLDGNLARYYSSEVLNIRDENTGEDPINIPILKPNLKLIRESQVDGRYQSFPIFEAEKSVEGGILGTNFIAPFVTINEHSKIMEMCRDVVRIIREKISYFADRKDNFARERAEESLSNLRLLIQAALPLESIIKANNIHPFEVFKYFLQTAASVTALNPAQLIPRLPVYNHEDLFASFNHLYEYICKILKYLKQKYDIITFTKIENEFQLKMEEDWLAKDEIAIGIQKPFSATDNDIINWIRGLQIASESMKPMIKDRRILGAERRILERGEYITQPAGMTIISVKAHTTYIRPGEKLCLMSSVRDFAPKEIILYAEKI